jgi:hypothetical protein
MSKKCPCGQPLKVSKSYSLSFACEGEVWACLCGREREFIIPDKRRAEFVNFTRKQAKVKKDKWNSNETSQERYIALADSL